MFSGKAFAFETGFLLKAETSDKSARVLLDVGDTDSACSRAYYAMYDAAHIKVSCPQSLCAKSLIIEAMPVTGR